MVSDSTNYSVARTSYSQEELQRFTQEKVLNSKTLQAESARKMSKKDLFDNLRKELEYALCSTLGLSVVLYVHQLRTCKVACSPIINIHVHGDMQSDH